MTGLEIEHPAAPSVPAAAGAEHVSAGEPAEENKLVGLGNVEALAVHLLNGNFKIFVEPLCYRVRGVDCPDALEIAVAPVQGAGGAHETLERL